MAAKDIEGFSMSKGGPGWKSCPECSGFVKGPLTKVCPNCKHEFTFKSRLASPASDAGSTGVSLEAAMLFTLKQGSVDKAKKALEALQANPAMAFAIAAGGVPAALAMLDKVCKKIDG